MKTKCLSRVYSFLSVAILCLAALSNQVLAQQYFDGPNTSSNNAVDGGSGVWDTVTTNWTTSNGSSNSAWAGGGAVFGLSGAGLYTVTLTSTAAMSCTGLTFNVGGYTLTGGTLNLTGSPSIQILQGKTTIASLLTGASGFSLTGPGLLSLTGNNAGFTGGITLNSGYLQASTNANALGGSGNALTLNGGLFEVTDSTGIAFGNNVSVTGNSGIWLDRGTTAGAGVTSTFGTLGIGNNMLTVYGGGATTSGTAGITFGAVTLSGSSTGTSSFNIVNRANGGYTQVTVGSVTGPGNMVKEGNGTLVINGNVDSGVGTFTQYNFNGSSTTVPFANGGTILTGSDGSTASMRIYGGTFCLTGTASLATSDLQLLGGILQFGTAISGTNVTRLTGVPNITLGGGRIQLYQPGTATVIDAAGTLTLKPGNSNLSITAGSSGTYNLNFTSLASRDTGSTISFSNSANFGARFSSAAPALNGGIIGGWAIYGTSWATVSGTGVNVGAATFDSTNINAPSGNNNIDQSFTSGTVTLATSSTINSLRTNGIALSNTTPILNLGGNTLTVASGGILFNNAASTASFIGNGTITAGSTAGAELFLTSVNSTGQAGIGAVIADNAGGSVNLVRGSDQTASLFLSGVNTYSGQTFINGATAVNNLASPAGSGGGPLSYINIMTGASAWNISDKPERQQAGHEQWRHQVYRQRAAFLLLAARHHPGRRRRLD